MTVCKCISVRQPWAWLIVQGHKPIENRDWKFAPKYRGDLLIHAASGMTRTEYDDVQRFLDDNFPSIKLPPDPMSDMRGGIVGKASLVDVVTESDSPWFFGRLGFVLAGAHPLPFMPYKGQLGLFDVDYCEA